jgi:hypothetical protein
MFGWSRTTCPLDPEAKAWVEHRLQWLTGQFESSAFTDKPVILPTAEFFPAPYDGSDRSIQTLLDQVCEYMEVDPDKIELDLFTAQRNLWFVNETGKPVSSGPAGTYNENLGKFHIRLDRNQADRPMALVGTMAHELSHARLLGERRIDRNVYDHEILTDLTTVFHGFGVFLANIPRNWSGAYTTWPNSELKKPEYMTPPMYAYALAHLAWHREETKPIWAKHLRLGARANLKQAMRYLQVTKDSSFKPWHARLGPD